MTLMDFMLLSPAARVLWSFIKGNNSKNAETQLAPVISSKSVEKKEVGGTVACVTDNKCHNPPLTWVVDPLYNHGVINQTHATNF